MNEILCITDVIIEPDIYDIETMKRPPHTLIRTWENVRGETGRLKFQRIYPKLRKDEEGNVVSMTIADKYYETGF